MRNEYDNTLRDLLFDESRSGFRSCPRTCSIHSTTISRRSSRREILVDAAETLAFEASARLMGDPAKRDQVLGCVPTGADDTRAYGRS